MTAPDVLAFADKKREGAYDVNEPSGTVVARIRVSMWSGSKFEATTGSGEPLCTGRKRTWSSSWDAVDPAGAPLVTVKGTAFSSKRRVTLPDERVLVLQGRWFGRDWALRDEAGNDVLTSEPMNSIWSFHPDAWIVRSHDATLSLAQVVAIVELHRLVVKAENASSSAGAAGS